MAFVTMDDLLGLAGSEANQIRKNYLTERAEALLRESTTERPEAVISTFTILLNDLNSYQSWTDTGAGYWGPPYSDSNTIRNNLAAARRNALARQAAAAGQAPQVTISTAPLKPVSVAVETVRALPAATVARAQEIAKGDLLTEEQRRVVTAPIAAIGISTKFVPKATAPSIPVPDAPATSWWSRTIDLATGTSAPAAPAAKPSAPAMAVPSGGFSVLDWFRTAAAATPTSEAKPAESAAVKPTPQITLDPSPPPSPGPDILKVAGDLFGRAASAFSGTFKIGVVEPSTRERRQITYAPIQVARPKTKTWPLLLGAGVAGVLVLGFGAYLLASSDSKK
jgi:hypothetical protein